MPTSTEPRRTSCDRCRGLKLRCERDEADPTRCQRCVRSKRVCAVTPEHRVGQSANIPLPPTHDANKFVFAEQYTVSNSQSLVTLDDPSGATCGTSDAANIGDGEARRTHERHHVQDESMLCEHAVDPCSWDIGDMAFQAYQDSPMHMDNGKLLDAEIDWDSCFAHMLNDSTSTSQTESVSPSRHDKTPLQIRRGQAHKALSKLQHDLIEEYERLRDLFPAKVASQPQPMHRQQDIPIKESVNISKRCLDVFESLRSVHDPPASPRLQDETIPSCPPVQTVDHSILQITDNPRPAVSTKADALKPPLDTIRKLHVLTCLMYMSRIYRIVFDQIFMHVSKAQSPLDLDGFDMPAIGFGPFQVPKMPVLQLHVFLEVSLQVWSSVTRTIGFTCVSNGVVGRIPTGLMADDHSIELLQSVMNDEVRSQEGELGRLQQLHDSVTLLPTLLQKLSDSQFLLAKSLIQGKSGAAHA